MATASDTAGVPNAAAPPTVRVQGTGTVEVEPDAARVSVGIYASRASLKKARQEAAAQATSIVASIKAAGIADRDIQTSRYTVFPRTDHDAKGKATTLGYDVRNSVTVTVRDLDALPALLDAEVAASANQVAGPWFFVQHPEKAEDEARRLAMASARRRAEVLAAAAGATLGRVLAIDEGSSRGQGEPRALYARSAVAMDATPIEAGTEQITASVEVVWELTWANGNPAPQSV